jgi:hypothetical protein
MKKWTGILLRASSTGPSRTVGLSFRFYIFARAWEDGEVETANSKNNKTENLNFTLRVFYVAFVPGKEILDFGDVELKKLYVVVRRLPVGIRIL